MIMADTDEHRVLIEPQLIADQLMVKCSCGWRVPVSFLDNLESSVTWSKAHELKIAHESYSAEHWREDG